MAITPDLAAGRGIDGGHVIAGHADIHDAADHERMGLRRSYGSERIDPGGRQPRDIAAVDRLERRKALVREIAAEGDPIAVRLGGGEEALIVDGPD